MAQHERTNRKKQEEGEKKLHVRQKESQLAFGWLHAWRQNTLSSGEAPFLPRMDEHTEILSMTHSHKQLANLVLNLQQTYGNRYVQRLMESIGMQARRTVNPPNDVYEEEADRVAKAVTMAAISEVPRQELEEAELARMQLDESQLATVSEHLETRINNARGSGQPLSDITRETMERAFGVDFSEVRVHTDSESDALNQQLNAKAFTTGSGIFFKRGAYDPISNSGQELIAHELSHVVQQSDGQSALQRHILLDEKEYEFSLEQEVEILEALSKRGLGEGYQRIVGDENVHIKAEGISATELAKKIIDGHYDDILKQAQAAFVKEEEEARVTAGALAEGEAKVAAAGATIEYTSLSAGCMAITVYFRGGGGVGLHYALNLDNARQWWKLRAAVGGRNIEKIQIETDVGVTAGGQGWWVKYKDGTPDTADLPRSRSWLQMWYRRELEGKEAQDAMAILNQKGWMCEIDNMERWFSATFGCNASLDPETNPAPKQF